MKLAIKPNINNSLEKHNLPHNHLLRDFSRVFQIPGNLCIISIRVIVFFIEPGVSNLIISSLHSYILSNIRQVLICPVVRLRNICNKTDELFQFMWIVHVTFMLQSTPTDSFTSLFSWDTM